MRVPHVRFDVRSRDLEENTQAFLRIADQFHEKLVDGWDVLVHCTFSHHRGPICFAGLVRRTTGTQVRVSVGFQQYGAQPRPTPCKLKEVRGVREPGASFAKSLFLLVRTFYRLLVTCYTSHVI